MALPSYLALCRWTGWRRGVLSLLALTLYAYLVEYIAVKTGFPYGNFEHGYKIGFKIAGTVPWTVPFAWTPLVLASFAMASRFANGSWLKTLLLSALLLVVIDLVLDPGAVSQGFWLYSRDGLASLPVLGWRFYDVPLSNFLGWFLSGFGASWILLKTLPETIQQNVEQTIPPRALMQSTFLVLCFWTSAACWMSLTIPCLIGVLLLMVFARTLFLLNS
jgi:putative membrane protein